ncbi:hypothetical protein HanIR_Chr17g0886061 [Helianthus annuus]|nr:hypothetical protein HanIR_Chr17g0886061 [Helianthus annuus]
MYIYIYKLLIKNNSSETERSSSERSLAHARIEFESNRSDQLIYKLSGNRTSIFRSFFERSSSDLRSSSSLDSPRLAIS